MSCSEIRKTLVEGLTLDAEQQRHVEDCALCAEYRDRLEVFREALRRHRLDVEPEAEFSARVLAQLPPDPDAFELLAIASLRWLPVGSVLALILGLGVALVPPAQGTEPLMAALLDDEAMVLWILEGLEVEP